VEGLASPRWRDWSTSISGPRGSKILRMPATWATVKVTTQNLRVIQVREAENLCSSKARYPERGVRLW